MGAETKLSAPVVELMLNLAASSPPWIENVGPGPASGSVAATVVTAVVFSATGTVALAPPLLEVITGTSFTLVTMTVTAWVSRSEPSLALTVTSYLLSPSTSPGASKFGAVAKFSRPPALMVNFAASAPVRV